MILKMIFKNHPKFNHSGITAINILVSALLFFSFYIQVNVHRRQSSTTPPKKNLQKTFINVETHSYTRSIFLCKVGFCYI